MCPRGMDGDNIRFKALFSCTQTVAFCLNVGSFFFVGDGTKNEPQVQSVKYLLDRLFGTGTFLRAQTQTKIGLQSKVSLTIGASKQILIGYQIRYRFFLRYKHQMCSIHSLHKREKAYHHCLVLSLSLQFGKIHLFCGLS